MHYFDKITTKNEQILSKRAALAWEIGLRYLKEFIECKGYAAVPFRHNAADGYKLGQWIKTQRCNKRKMSLEHKTILESLPGWIWNVNENAWERGFHYLKEFAKNNSLSNIFQSYKTEYGYPLGRWISRQRIGKRKLLAGRQARLETLPGWTWSLPSINNFSSWEKGFRYLREFTDENAHSNVPQKYRSEDGYQLGVWVNSQRMNKNSLTFERKSRLEALPRWTFNVIIAKWEYGFSRANEFADREGHAMVPTQYCTADGYRLGSWISMQRTRKNKLSSERKTRLESLPSWVW
jgi:hypothetical protein